MNKAIKEDFDYRKELKSWFELSIEKIWELIDRDSGNQNFWSIYSKENILDPYNDFDNETKERAKNSNSKWFCLNSGFSEIGSDYDLQCYYDDYRSSNKRSVDDIKDDILDDYIYYCQSHAHDDLLGCEITELNNDGVREQLELCNRSIDSCEIVGDINDFNDDNCSCSWFFIHGACEDITIYQNWDQVWENIIYESFPEEWLKDFAQ